MSSHDTVGALFRSLRGSHAPLTAGVARAMYEHATRCGDIAALAALAARTDVPDDVVELLAARTDADVRAAYLARPGHSPESLVELLSSERRATVIAAAARHPDAPGELVEAASHDTRRAVVFAVLENPSAPMSARIRAARCALESADRLPWNLRSALIDAVLATPPLHDEVARADQDPLGIRTRLASSPALQPATVALLVDRFVVTPLEAGVPYPPAATPLPWNQRQFMSWVSGFAQELAANPSLDPVDADRMVAALELPVGRIASSTIETVRRILGVIASDRDLVAAVLARAAEATDSGELADLTRQMASKHESPLDPDPFDLADALARNPSADHRTVVEALNQLAKADDGLLRLRAAVSDVVASSAADRMSRVVLAAPEQVRVVALAAVAAAGDGALSELLTSARMAVGVTRTATTQLTELFAAVLDQAANRDAVLSAAPFDLLAGLAARSPAGAAEVMDLLDPALGAQESRELFRVLAVDFEGSTETLLSTVESVGAVAS